MSHLSAAQLLDLRAELERELEKLQASMAVTDEALKPVALDQTAVGRLSRMDSLQSQGMAQGLREREVLKLALIGEALQRLDDGTYGVCTQCGGAVELGRLVVFPETGTCSACGS